MSRILSIATAVPPHSVTAEEAQAHLLPYFESRGEDPALIEQIFRNSQIDQRCLAKPQEFYLRERSLTARNKVYGEVAAELGVEVCRKALAKAGVEPREVDLVIDTSCTGIMIPALDATLVNALELRRDVVRLPLTEVGCAAGAVALSRADDYLRAYPEATVLVVSVELPSLTLQLDDGSRANMVSAALFGDGAAAAVLRGPGAAGGRGFEILGHRSALFPNTLDMMGFELRTEGFTIVLNRRIPALVKRELRGEVDSFLAGSGHTLADIGFTVLHPGGSRVLDNVRDVLELTEPQVRSARDMLRRFGNLSSASVFFVARDVIQSGEYADGDLGLLCAMGPGFAIELVLLAGRV